MRTPTAVNLLVDLRDSLYGSATLHDRPNSFTRSFALTSQPPRYPVD